MHTSQFGNFVAKSIVDFSPFRFAFTPEVPYSSISNGFVFTLDCVDWVCWPILSTNRKFIYVYSHIIHRHTFIMQDFLLLSIHGRLLWWNRIRFIILAGLENRQIWSTKSRVTRIEINDRDICELGTRVGFMTSL